MLACYKYAFKYTSMQKKINSLHKYMLATTSNTPHSATIYYCKATQSTYKPLFVVTVAVYLFACLFCLFACEFRLLTAYLSTTTHTHAATNSTPTPLKQTPTHTHKHTDNSGDVLQMQKRDVAVINFGGVGQQTVANVAELL